MARGWRRYKVKVAQKIGRKPRQNRAEEAKHLLEALPDEVFDPQGSCRSRGLALGYVAFDVFAEDVGFKVDGVAGGTVGDVGVLVGVGDDSDFGDGRTLGGLPIGHSEADAVHGEGTFPDDVGCEIGGDVDTEAPGFAILLEMGDVAHGVDVT